MCLMDTIEKTLSLSLKTMTKRNVPIAAKMRLTTYRVVGLMPLDTRASIDGVPGTPASWKSVTWGAYSSSSEPPPPRRPSAIPAPPATAASSTTPPMSTQLRELLPPELDGAVPWLIAVWSTGWTLS